MMPRSCGHFSGGLFKRTAASRAILLGVLGTLGACSAGGDASFRNGAGINAKSALLCEAASTGQDTLRSQPDSLACIWTPSAGATVDVSYGEASATIAFVRDTGGATYDLTISRDGQADEEITLDSFGSSWNENAFTSNSGFVLAAMEEDGTVRIKISHTAISKGELSISIDHTPRDGVSQTTLGTEGFGQWLWHDMTFVYKDGSWTPYEDTATLAYGDSEAVIRIDAIEPVGADIDFGFYDDARARVTFNPGTADETQGSSTMSGSEQAEQSGFRIQFVGARKERYPDRQILYAIFRITYVGATSDGETGSGSPQTEPVTL